MLFASSTPASPILPTSSATLRRRPWQPLGGARRGTLPLTLPMLLIACILGLGSAAEAEVCKVEPNGNYDYTNVHDAMADRCDGSDPAGDEILVLCEAGSGPCVHEQVEILGRENLAIRVQGDPTVFDDMGNGGAIRIVGSKHILIEGAFDATSQHDPAISIIKSLVTLMGHPSERYATLHADSDAALYIAGESKVHLDTIALVESPVGLRTDELARRGPKITGTQMRIFGNEQAGIITGGTNDCGDPSAPLERSEVTFDLAPDFQPNYVEANIDGFIVDGNSILDLRHTILLGNLRTSDVLPDTALLRTRGCGTLYATQILAYDNDPWADAGRDITSWWPAGGGAIAKTEENSNIVIETSTLVHNHQEFGMWPTNLKGSITFLSSVADQTGIKGVPCSSGYFYSNATSTVYGSGLSNYDGCFCNYAGPQPPPSPLCGPSPLNLSVDPGGWDTSSVPQTSPWPVLPKGIYRMLRSPFLDAGPGTASSALFPSGATWATDLSTPEIVGSPVDWGYHSF